MLVFIFCRHQIEKKQEKLRSVKTNSLKINESNQKKNKEWINRIRHYEQRDKSERKHT